ncbi:hypothetical protein ACTFIT_005802 [Dictyostelium discoideum]
MSAVNFILKFLKDLDLNINDAILTYYVKPDEFKVFHSTTGKPNKVDCFIEKYGIVMEFNGVTSMVTQFLKKTYTSSQRLLKTIENDFEIVKQCNLVVVWGL